MLYWLLLTNSVSNITTAQAWLSWHWACDHFSATVNGSCCVNNKQFEWENSNIFILIFFCDIHYVPGTKTVDNFL